MTRHRRPPKDTDPAALPPERPRRRRVPGTASSHPRRPPLRRGDRALGPRVCPERGSVSLREAPRIGSVSHRDTCRGHRHSAPLLGTDVLNLRLGDGRHATPPGRTSTTVTMRRCLSDPLTSPLLWWPGPLESRTGPRGKGVRGSDSPNVCGRYTDPGRDPRGAEGCFCYCYRNDTDISRGVQQLALHL